jgi:hypothetical protein
VIKQEKTTFAPLWSWATSALFVAPLLAAAPATVWALSADPFEPNDTFETAANFSGKVALSELIITPGDEDFFAWRAARDGSLRVDILFSHAVGDLDLDLFNESMQRVGLSDSLTDNESVSHIVFAGQKLFVHVFGFQATTNTYSLEISGSATIPEPSSILLVGVSLAALLGVSKLRCPARAERPTRRASRWARGVLTR